MRRRWTEDSGKLAYENRLQGLPWKDCLPGGTGYYACARARIWAERKGLPWPPRPLVRHDPREEAYWLRVLRGLSWRDVQDVLGPRRTQPGTVRHFAMQEGLPWPAPQGPYRVLQVDRKRAERAYHLRQGMTWSDVCSAVGWDGEDPDSVLYLALMTGEWAREQDLAWPVPRAMRRGETGWRLNDAG